MTRRKIAAKKLQNFSEENDEVRFGVRLISVCNKISIDDNLAIRLLYNIFTYSYIIICYVVVKKFLGLEGDNDNKWFQFVNTCTSYLADNLNANTSLLSPLQIIP